MYPCIYIHTCIHLNMYIRIHLYIHTSKYVYTYSFKYVFVLVELLVVGAGQVVLRRERGHIWRSIYIYIYI